MKKTKLTMAVALLVTASALFFTGCPKDPDVPYSGPVIPSPNPDPQPNPDPDPNPNPDPNPVTEEITNGFTAVGCCPSDNLTEVYASLRKLREEDFCPADAWILNNE